MMFCCNYYFMVNFNATINYIILHIFTAICCSNVNEYCIDISLIELLDVNYLFILHL